MDIVPSPSVTTLLECNGNGYIQPASQIFSLTKAGEINRLVFNTVRFNAFVEYLPLKAIGVESCC